VFVIPNMPEGQVRNLLFPAMQPPSANQAKFKTLGNSKPIGVILSEA